VPSDSPKRYNVESPESNGRRVTRGCEIWLSATALRDTGSHSSPHMARAFMTREGKSSSLVKAASVPRCTASFSAAMVCSGVTRDNGTRGKISFSFSAVSRPHCGSPAISKPPDQARLNGLRQGARTRLHAATNFKFGVGLKRLPKPFTQNTFGTNQKDAWHITLLRAVRAVDARNNPSEYGGTRPLALALGTIKSR
jgi:hypothetical protein